MNAIKSGSAYYPPTRALSVAAGIFGLRPGDFFDKCEEVFAALVDEGFEAPPPRNPSLAQQFTLRHSGAGGTDAALYVVIDKSGRMDKVSLTFGGEPVGSPQLAAASAKTIRDFLESTLGPQAVVVDRIEEWARGSMHSSAPDIAYAAAWAQGRTEVVRVDDGADFEAAVATLTSVVTTALVTSQKDLAVVMVIAERPAVTE